MGGCATKSDTLSQHNTANLSLHVNNHKGDNDSNSSEASSTLHAANEPISPSEAAKMENMKKTTRRAAVSAESVKTDDAMSCEEMLKDIPKYPKDDETTNHLREIITKSDKLNVLFGQLSQDRINDIIQYMHHVEVPIEHNIITQGEVGDAFYIVESGIFDIFVARANEEPKKVTEATEGGCFGELALMYDAPRAATVTAATEDCSVWKLDRVVFKTLIVYSENDRKRKYESFLQEIEIFQDLNRFEIGQLCDLLTEETYTGSKEAIIRQGDVGDKFYILASGEAKAFIQGEEGEIEVKHYFTPGEYFGEIALLSESSQRVASVYPFFENEDTCIVLSVCKEDFDRVLGPVSDILRRNIDKYPKYKEFL